MGRAHHGSGCKTLVARFPRPWKLHLGVASIPNPNFWSERFVNLLACFEVVETLVHGIGVLLVLITHLVWGSYLLPDTLILHLVGTLVHGFLCDWSKVCLHSYFIHIPFINLFSWSYLIQVSFWVTFHPLVFMVSLMYQDSFLVPLIQVHYPFSQIILWSLDLNFIHSSKAFVHIEFRKWPFESNYFIVLLEYFLPKEDNS